MNTLLIAISAGSGPEECAHVAALTLQLIQEEAQSHKSSEINITVVETIPSLIKGNIQSALISVEGNRAHSFITDWTGTIQWIYKSKYRPYHRRKNWFVSVKPITEPEKGELFSPDDVHFETARAAGPGGQHVNKTETSVRAIHVPTGKSVVVRSERSQLMNKKLALARLSSLFKKEQERMEGKSRSDRRHSHWELERGNPIRVYDGVTLKLIRKNHISEGKNKNA